MYKKGYGNIPNKDKIIYYLEEAYRKRPGRWISRLFLVGKTAEAMADDLGLDKDIAFACGALGKIGLMKSDEKDFLYGYQILRDEAYFFPARLAISQAFVIKDLGLYENIYKLDDKEKEFLEKFLYKYSYTDYDLLVQYLYMIFADEYIGLARGMDMYLLDYDEKIRQRYLDLEAYFKERLSKDLESYLPKIKKSKFPYKLFSNLDKGEPKF